MSPACALVGRAETNRATPWQRSPSSAPGYSLLKLATWPEGLALGPEISAASVNGLLRSRARWVGREPGSGARQCQDDLLQDRPEPRRLASDHRGVAEAIRCGWADVGVCVRIACEDAGLRFIQVRDEAYDLCFATGQEGDPRLRALLQADAVGALPQMAVGIARLRLPKCGLKPVRIE